MCRIYGCPHFLLRDQKNTFVVGMPEESEPHDFNSVDCLFEWDQESNLFFHRSSGFYHDPTAGWYYNSRDGQYYKFGNGNYELLTFNEVHDDQVDHQNQNEIKEYPKRFSDEPISQDCIFENRDEDNPLPPSDWMEETLINLYLSGYSDTSNKNAHSDVQIEKLTTEEEKWRAQYGGVEEEIDSSEKHQYLSSIDLWDWRTEVSEPQKGEPFAVVRVVGRRQSSDLHTAHPFNRRPLKTAPICQAHLDLVRVTTGKVYKLRRPSAKYIASLSFYDSSDPTKCWGFPEISVIFEETERGRESDISSSNQTTTSREKCEVSSVYRDRAMERRALHGGFGVGIGQKRIIHQSGLDEVDDTVGCTPFGTGSRARKILENMGWKEGQPLGCRKLGLLEPLEAVGNIGNAGIGWRSNRTP